MKKGILAILSALFVVASFTAPAFAGSPHFVGTPTVTFSADNSTVTVMAKEAGLGNESQIVAVLSGTAECINGGGNNPSAGNKMNFSSSSKEPVQNGKADYTITATAAFKPSCSPPMTVEWTSLVLTDTTNSISVKLI